ncbi:MAG: transglycosylase SLT domain-containing protein [Bacteroidia bacterium]|nr:transglycosylase SLT domain-containing protein [Bacteroidia bacterium]
MKPINNYPDHEVKKYALVPFIGNIPFYKIKGFSIAFVLIIVSNLLTNSFFNPDIFGNIRSKKGEKLYLSERAAIYVSDITSFEEKVREVSQKLEIPPEWLMSVMYSESRFDAAAVNIKGSGAVGLIQFMPATAIELGTTTAHLQRLTHTGQLDYVFQYLNKIKSKYGKFENLTDLYLGILYPKAIKGDDCYILYTKSSIHYKQNSGLDENKDGAVTVGDIHKRMIRLYPKAYETKMIQ